MILIDDTIAAIATAPGEGGIGIVRLSGNDAYKILGSIFVAGKNKPLEEYSQRSMIYGHIYDDDKVVDEVLAVYMKGPNTYTREDIVEINCHGGFISVKKILELCLRKGARLSDRGEFTKRAFLNGRIDLSQAEAVMDIIGAKTDKAYNIAQNQLEGGLSSRIKDLRFKVTEMLAHIAVALDFPEEDAPELTYDSLLKGSNEIREGLDVLYKTSETGKIMRDGLRTVIVGRPNVGKSSLLNAILKESRAIVTNIPGTTRDVIEEMVNLRGIPLRIVDTAGIRETEDVVEKIGVEKSKQFLDIADLVIMMLDSSQTLTEEDLDIMESIQEKKALILINKVDLEQKIDEEKIRGILPDKEIIKISAQEGHGLIELENSIENMVYTGEIKAESDVMVTNVRHREAIEKAIESCEDAIRAINEKIHLEFIEVDIKNIWDYLGEVTGDTVSEDLLDTIFSQFCIGK